MIVSSWPSNIQPAEELLTCKALSLLQPWASLLACGAKRIETRSWHTR